MKQVTTMLNRVILMGRLTADPELKQTQGEISVTSFSIAVERNLVDKATGKRGADFVNIVAWRGTAELICKYFAKGRLIALEGSIQTRNYEDKNGNKRTAFEVVADNVYFTGEKKDDTSSSADDVSTRQPPQSSKQPFSIGDFEQGSDYEEFDTDPDLPY